MDKKVNPGNVSGSSVVIEHLRSMDPMQTFSSLSLREEFPRLSSGVITGLMAKLRKKGFIKEVGRDKGTTLYNISGDLDEYHMRKLKGAGGVPGRSSTGLSRKQRMINTLFALVEEVEQMKADLNDFTVKELLNEVEKRTK